MEQVFACLSVPPGRLGIEAPLAECKIVAPTRHFYGHARVWAGGVAKCDSSGQCLPVAVASWARGELERWAISPRHLSQ